MNKVFILGLALFAACAANAIPTLTGPTGGFELPTADIAPSVVTVAVDQGTNQNHIVYPNSRLLLGFGKMLEIGGKYEQVTQRDEDGSFKTDVWDVNAKVQLVHIAGFKLAVGAVWGQMLNNNLGTIDHQGNGYAAATIHVGDIKLTANAGYSKDIDAGTKGWTGGLAAEKMLGERTALGAEYLCGDKTGVFGDVNPAKNHADIYVTHAISSSFSARVAIGGLGQDTSMYLGGAYRFTM